MAISPVGGMLYANQNMQTPATKQAEFQQRLDAQTTVAMSESNEEQKQVKEVRPTEETYKIDPEKEHEQQKHDEEAGAEEEQMYSRQHAVNEDDEDFDENRHLLDLKI